MLVVEIVSDYYNIVYFQMLGVSDWVDKELNVQFILSTEGEYTGGFSKWPKCHPGKR